MESTINITIFPTDTVTHEYWLFILAIPVACICWTVTKEEIFREPREYFINKSKTADHIWKRKLYYMFSCEYCFSHYVTLLLLIMTRYTLLYSGWTGYFIAGFSIIWVANVYMSLYNLIRIDLKKEKIIAKKEALSIEVPNTNTENPTGPATAG